MDGDDVLAAGLEGSAGLGADGQRLVARDESASPWRQARRYVNFHVLIVEDEELQVCVVDASGMVNWRRIQMSSVFQVVRTTAPGVPCVPKPAGPCFQAESSKSGPIQLAGGLLRRVAPGDRLLLATSGTTSVTLGGGGSRRPTADLRVVAAGPLLPRLPGRQAS